MRADNTHHLTEAARRRAQLTRRRAVAALRRMDTTGLAVTIDALAARRACPGPGSTTNPTCGPRPNSCATDSVPDRAGPSRTASAPPSLATAPRRTRHTPDP
jgi:hypothetical protein